MKNSTQSDTPTPLVGCSLGIVCVDDSERCRQIFVCLWTLRFDARHNALRFCREACRFFGGVRRRARRVIGFSRQSAKALGQRRRARLRSTDSGPKARREQTESFQGRAGQSSHREHVLFTVSWID